MAEMTIRLQTDPVSGKKNILVSLKSDEDSMPHEHEQQHKQLVEKLIEGGVLSAADAGRVIVEREEETASGERARERPPAEQQSLEEDA
ncbi:MAG: hypothetical protein NXI04_23095 [Planctomycetaceae bacterium]|nr:hypothetical protein [Planctomycetaceae bacterium]